MELDFSEQIRSNASLWENIRKKKERIKRGSNEKMRKPGEKGAPTKEQIERAKGKDKRIPEKKKDGTKRPKSEHSDLYTDENPKGTIKGLGFKDAETARKSVNIIEKASKPHKHKVQATMAMEQRSRFAAKNAKDPEKKKNLLQANKIYKAYLEKLKKRTAN
jgi:hypothetical protein